MSGADRLREAARVLRERAEADPYLARSLEQHAEDHSSYDCRFEPCAMETVADAILGTQP